MSPLTPVGVLKHLSQMMPCTSSPESLNQWDHMLGPKQLHFNELIVMHLTFDSFCSKAATPSFIQPALFCICVPCALRGDQVNVSDVTQIWGHLLKCNGLIKS